MKNNKTLNESKDTQTANDKGVISTSLLATDFRPLYQAVSAMMSILDANAVITTNWQEVHDVAKALYDLDEGEYNADKLFGS